MKEGTSLTAKYISKELSIPVPAKRRKWKEFIEILGARENNLKNIDVKFPLNVMTVMTGVSGSGKTSLVRNILYPAIRKIYGGYGEKTGKLNRLGGDVNRIYGIEFVDQNPIGRSSRSNPATYLKAFDEIRTLFAEHPASQSQGIQAGIFFFQYPRGPMRGMRRRRRREDRDAVHG